jgi:hypothetical protein
VIRIESKELLGFLTDLERTCMRGVDSGVLLHAARGPYGEEPGDHPLLVGTSYGAGGIGHAHIGCAGAMEPMLWPAAGVDMVLELLKKVGKAKKHGVLISRLGDEITVAEDPDLRPDGASVSFTGGQLTSFAHTVWHAMEPRPLDAQEILEGDVRACLYAASVTPFARIASRRGEPMRLWRYGRQLLIEIGEHYRGQVQTLPVDELHADGPQAPIYVPELPVEAQDETIPDRLLAEAASLIIHQQQARPELLTRRLRVGSARAALLLRQLEARDVVAAPAGRSAVRDVLASRGGRQSVLDRIQAEIDQHHSERPKLVVQSQPDLFVNDDEDNVDG